MPDVVASIADAEVRLGQLVANHQVCDNLRDAIQSGAYAARLVPSAILNVIRLGAWRDQFDRDRQSRGSFADFRAFVEKPVRECGLGSTVEEVRRYLGEGTEERIAFEDLIRTEPGPPPGNQNAAGPRTGTLDLDRCKTTPNNIRDCFAPTTDEPPPVVRDRSGEPQAGTSIGYAVRRLGRERPDLLHRVRTGELTANQAMIRAGFRRPTITIPDEPRAAARRLARHFDGEALDALIRELEALRGP